MGVKITGLNKYSARLRSESKRINDEAVQVAQESAEFGANLMRDFIRRASTKTGLARGQEGRIKTSTMLNAVSVGNPRRLGQGGVAINYGWGVDGQRTEPYFFYQEVGAGHIPPMHALLDSLVRTREYFYARLKEVI